MTWNVSIFPVFRFLCFSNCSSYDVFESYNFLGDHLLQFVHLLLEAGQGSPEVLHVFLHLR